MESLKLDFRDVLDFVSEDDINKIKQTALNAQNLVLNKNGTGNEFLGWVDYPNQIKEEELNRIIEVSKKIRKESQVLVVIGIGGSYLGAKAALDMLSGYFRKEEIEIIFAGQTISSTYLSELLEYLKNKDFSINVISKSGTTTEPAIAFRLLKKLLIEKYKDKAASRIYATTDPNTGALRKQAIENGYITFDIPSDIGGRYSVLTAVGLLPLAVANIDIKAIIEGAKASREKYIKVGFDDNDALKYASVRNVLYKKKKYIELFVSYEPKHRFLSEWLKQLFGESEGKEGKGLFPASLIYSTDLHSVGQFVQDGTKILFETSIKILNSNNELTIEEEKNNGDNLNYLAGMTLDYINTQTYRAVTLAHKAGNVPNISLELLENDAYHFGYIVYFFMLSCAYSGYILGVNPFDQEGVEAYKTNMFKLLGKPGYK